jgi:uncharacterized membrane protein YkoI
MYRSKKHLIKPYKCLTYSLNKDVKRIKMGKFISLNINRRKKMKKMILIIALIIAGWTVKAQDASKQQTTNNVPQNVSSSFSQKFPDVSMNSVDWDNEGGYYKAEFSKQDKDYEALFDNTGKWITTEIDNISMSEIPQSVQQGLQKTSFAGYTVNDIEMIQSQDLVLYKVEVRSGLKSSDLYLDDRGNVVQIDI